jgi:hypothetical protein
MASVYSRTHGITGMKTADRLSLHVRLDERQKRHLEQAAEQADRSQTGYVRYLVERDMRANRDEARS